MRLKTGLLAAAAVLALALPAAASAQEVWGGYGGYNTGYNTGYSGYGDYSGGYAQDWRERHEASERWQARREAIARRDEYARERAEHWRREHAYNYSDGNGWNGYGDRGYGYEHHHDDEE